MKRFRWSAGHADLSAALRDADLLAAIGPALDETGRQAVLLGAFAVDARRHRVTVSHEHGVDLL